MNKQRMVFSSSSRFLLSRWIIEFLLSLIKVFFPWIVSYLCMTLFYFGFLSTLHLSHRITFVNVLNSFSRIFTECDNKTYGLDCRESCGNCSNGELCHHVDGSCPYACDVGVYGKTCDKGIV